MSHAATSAADPPPVRHPRGLYTLFFTEMWERFSYYGMRALLILFMVDTARGGFGMEVPLASAVYGLYTFGVYAMAVPGGWMADRLLGKKKAVLWGGIIIALGHYTLAIHNQGTFFAGLFLVVLGTGLLKPNVSAVVGDLYPIENNDPTASARRDAGFSIFYSGINVGAFLGQIVCPLLGEKVDWHLGFGAAAIGMTLGVIQYWFGQKHLEGAGDLSAEAASQTGRGWKMFAAGAGAFAALAALAYFLVRGGAVDFVRLVEFLGVSVAGLAAVYFAYILIFVCRDSGERGRIGVVACLFVGAALFWSGFEQAGSSMTLFANDYTDRMVGDFEVPAGSLQNVNAILIMLLAPVVGMMWVKLGSRNPSIPIKFALGLGLLGVGFMVLAWGAMGIEDGKVGMRWLVVTYFFHSVGELCLSPVGLSSVTKLSPDRLVGQMMGTWFMGAALGNLIAGLVAGRIENLPIHQLFGTVAAISIGSGLLFVVLAPLMRRWAGNVR
jgi:POT family proton-dependent oligopeptide transporter